MILSYSNLNRKTILNNIEKIKSFYENKSLSEDSLDVLLNSDRNEMFENIRDAALNGDKTELKNLLNNFSFVSEDAYLYLNILNFRLIKVLEILKLKDNKEDITSAMSKILPPIFWKDKPAYIKLLKKWDKQRVLEALEYLGKTEKTKNNSTLNSLTVVKNSITNLCAKSCLIFKILDKNSKIQVFVLNR